MSHWESNGKSDDWLTPKYIFDALAERFDTDVASPPHIIQTHVPCKKRIWLGSPDPHWEGFIWMNPPFGGRNGIAPWLEKFFAHGNGIALVPDRTSAPWFQKHARRGLILFVTPKIKFERLDGTLGKSPSTGTALLGAGSRASVALDRASTKLGMLVSPI